MASCGVEMLYALLACQGICALCFPRNSFFMEVKGDFLRDYLCVGTIAKPQGIRGEVKVQPHTDDPQRFMSLKWVWIDGQKVPITHARVLQNTVYITLEGINDRNEAELLRGKELMVDRENAAPLPKGRYYIVDLIGLTVEDRQGRMLGRLADVIQAGGNDVYSIEGERGFLFPALKRVILSVDLAEKRMVLDEEALSEVAVYED